MSKFRFSKPGSQRWGLAENKIFSNVVVSPSSGALPSFGRKTKRILNLYKQRQRQQIILKCVSAGEVVRLRGGLLRGDAGVRPPRAQRGHTQGPPPHEEVSKLEGAKFWVQVGDLSRRFLFSNVASFLECLLINAVSMEVKLAVRACMYEWMRGHDEALRGLTRFLWK